MKKISKLVFIPVNGFSALNIQLRKIVSKLNELVKSNKKLQQRLDKLEKPDKPKK